MPQVTVTDIKVITEIKDVEILRWISLHKDSLESKEMEEHWDAIKNDLKKLEDEYNLRHPEIVLLRKILKEVTKPEKFRDTIGSP